MKQLFLEVKDYILKNRVKLLSYSFIMIMSLSTFLTCRKIKLPYVINRTSTVTAENMEVVKDIYYINLKTIDKSQKLSESFNYRPDTYFNDQIYWKSYITFIKSTDNEAGFYMVTNYPMPQNTKLSLYYIVLQNGTFQHDKDYIPMIYPIFSVYDPLNKIEL